MDQHKSVSTLDSCSNCVTVHTSIVATDVLVRCIRDGLFGAPTATPQATEWEEEDATQAAAMREQQSEEEKRARARVTTHIRQH